MVVDGGGDSARCVVVLMRGKRMLWVGRDEEKVFLIADGHCFGNKRLRVVFVSFLFDDRALLFSLGLQGLSLPLTFAL